MSFLPAVLAIVLIVTATAVIYSAYRFGDARSRGPRDLRRAGEAKTRPPANIGGTRGLSF